MKNHPQTLSLTDIHCASCVQTIESALNACAEVESASVNFAEKTVDVTSTLDSNAIIELIAKAGYTAAPMPTEADANREPRFGWFGQCILPLLWGGILLALDYWPTLTLSNATGVWIWRGLGLVTLIILIQAGGHFYQNAWRALKRGRSTMDTLIALGTGTAFVFSAFVVLFPEFFQHSQQVIYFDASVLILGLVNLGGFLENRAKRKTADAVKALTALQPKTATLVVDGIEKTVTIAELKKGDCVRIKPGEQIPVDGVVENGSTAVDESMLTGEPIAVTKKAGDTLSGGTINQQGSILMRVTAVGKDTALAHIIEAVRQAQQGKPPIAKMADKICGVFVPCVLLIAIITGFVWYYSGGSVHDILLTTLSVLVIACPCAIGLASPIAVMLGTGQAAKSGLLIRSGEAIELLPQITTVVFDKTGTITEGNARVTDLLLLDPSARDAVLTAAASLEAASEHPLGQAIVTYAASEKHAPTSVDQFHSETGMGVTGVVNGQTVHIGKLEYLAHNHVQCDRLSQLGDDAQYAACTLVYLAIETTPHAVFAISDPIKADAKTAMSALHELGIKTIMLTGDQEKTAQHIAKAVGIDDVFANVLPTDKQAVIQDLQKNGDRVVMVGDGINDAPALTQADIGIAIGTGTDIAMAASEITLMRESLMGVIDAIDICKRTLKIIKQNFVGSFFYNSVGILIAAGVFYPWFHWLLNPWMASAAMALSSITVVLNASRLRAKRNIP